MPLTENKDDYKRDNEAHLVNKYDELGNIPIYEPYSLVSFGFTPLSSWVESDNHIISVQQPNKIADPKEFKALTSVTKDIYFKLQDKNQNQT